LTTTLDNGVVTNDDHHDSSGDTGPYSPTTAKTCRRPRSPIDITRDVVVPTHHDMTSRTSRYATRRDPDRTARA
jgi:hypothetical protein